jgi:hypothetical protein
MPWRSPTVRTCNIASHEVRRPIPTFVTCGSGIIPSRIVRFSTGLLMSVIAIGIVACGANATRSTTRPAADGTASSAPPVTLSVFVTQRGMVAQRNVELITTIMVTNHTNQPIKVVAPYCSTPLPPVLIEVDDVTDQPIWQTHLWDGPCPFMPPRDVQSISPSASITWVVTNDLSKPSLFVGVPPDGSLRLQAGATYIVRVTLLEWHQGDLNDLGTPGIPQGTDVIGTASIVLR